jgi:hypothetical protein
MVVWNLHSLLYIHRGVRYRQLKINDVMVTRVNITSLCRFGAPYTMDRGWDGDGRRRNQTQPGCDSTTLLRKWIV